jgi:UDP-N-acetyl-D-glucosamine/UDP-N-acetyl-D-galactosamine dehydrogenase
MGLLEKIVSRQEKISVVGLGYVGMPLAVAFAERAEVIGFDVNKAKIEQYKAGHDMTKEVGDERLRKTTVQFTSDEKELRKAKFHIVAVPTPVNPDTSPDLRPVISAAQVVGRNLVKGSIVVFESTVYPGVTEEVCMPILEKESGLRCGADFKIGYSPERINPGDKVHTVDKIIKIVSGMDGEALEDIAGIYELIIAAGIYKAESIKVAEAAKVIENSQRDINIAFMNELSIIFNKMGIDTKAVLEAAGTKWNFLKFYPGLVGGHCIGVDPYYLTYRAQQLGYHSQVILSGRRINDGMGKYAAENTVKNLIKADKQIKGAKAAVMGITFKENCPDVRNSKVIDIIRELEEYGIEVKIHDPIADREEVWKEYRIQLCELEDIRNMDAVIFAVAHEGFKDLSFQEILELYADKDKKSVNPVLIDLKGIFDKNLAAEGGFMYWRL